MKVKEIMTSDTVCARAPSSRSDVIKLMVTNNKTAVPLIRDSDNQLLGVITRQSMFDNPEQDQLALIVDKNIPSIKPDLAIEKAAKLLIDSQIHILPVVKGKKLIGVLTSSDFLKIIEDGNYDLPVDELIHSTCVGIYKESPLSVAVKMISLSKVYALAVLNDEARLVGLLTDRDIFNLADIDASVAISELGLGDDEDAWTWEGLRNVMKLYYEESKIKLPDLPIKEVMVKNPMKVFKKTTTSEAAKLMRKHDYGQLPLTDSDDRLFSMIYELDLLRVLL